MASIGYGQNARERCDTCDALGHYLADIGREPLLPTAVLLTLIERAQRGDRDARDRAVNANLRLVVFEARQLRRGDVPLLDLIQAGNEGLLHAVAKFDVTRQIAFSTYAVRWIRQNMVRHRDGLLGALHVPPYLHVWQRAIWRATESLTSTDQPITDATLSEATGLTIAQLERTRACTFTQVSLASVITSGDDELTLGDLLAAPVAASTTVSPRLQQALDGLSCRERMVLGWRFGLDDEEPLALHEVADRLGITVNTVRQIECHARLRLRAALGGR